MKGVTINYHNRIEQDLEVKMVNKWLQLLNIEHHVKVITEIVRPRDKNRDFYEKVTKNIRFNTYKKVQGIVILGHNRDDTLENIFSNIKKNKSYDNLLGMSIYSVEKEVELLRPLLNISKKDIIDFAIKYKIPFVYDSTPKWSERGKMRDILIPQIKEFDKSILDGLIELSNNFKEIYKFYNNYVLKIPIVYNIDSCSVNMQNIYFFDYWKNVLSLICNHYNCKMIKNKSIMNLINNISENKKGNRITLSKNIICQQSNNIITFYIK
jgi:tRNA(Ile)-lysidine synthase TilS/MesJ